MPRFMKRLSDDQMGFVHKTMSDTMKYRAIPMSGNMIRLEVVGRFYSDEYGTCVIGYDKEVLIKRLTDKLQREFGFVGRVEETDKDDVDRVGKRTLNKLSVLTPTNNIGARRELSSIVGKE